MSNEYSIWMLVLINVLFLVLAFVIGIYACKFFGIKRMIDRRFLMIFLFLISILIQAKFLNIGQYFLEAPAHNPEYILKVVSIIMKIAFPMYIVGKIIDRQAIDKNS